MSRDGGLRQLFSERFPYAHWQAVETWSTGQGVPDAEYCFPGGVTGWVEYKMATAMAVAITPQQVAWAERRTRAGGRVTLAVRKKALPGLKRQAVDALYMYAGQDARAVLEKGLRAHPLAKWEGGPAAWDWIGIMSVLTRPVDQERQAVAASRDGEVRVLARSVIDLLVAQGRVERCLVDGKPGVRLLKP